jgi:RecG-like helicase
VLADRLRDLFASTEEHDDEVARQEVDRLGCERIAELEERRHSRATGVVTSLLLPPSGAAVRLEAELYDGTGTLTLVWLGRRSIEGISPGVHLVVEGMMASSGSGRTMYNPAYRILPSAELAS